MHGTYICYSSMIKYVIYLDRTGHCFYSRVFVLMRLPFARENGFSNLVAKNLSGMKSYIVIKFYTRKCFVILLFNL